MQENQQTLSWTVFSIFQANPSDVGFPELPAALKQSWFLLVIYPGAVEQEGEWIGGGDYYLCKNNKQSFHLSLLIIDWKNVVGLWDEI